MPSAVNSIGFRVNPITSQLCSYKHGAQNALGLTCNFTFLLGLILEKRTCHESASYYTTSSSRVRLRQSSVITSVWVRAHITTVRVVTRNLWLVTEQSRGNIIRLSNSSWNYKRRIGGQTQPVLP